MEDRLKCPSCGTYVTSGTTVCPACHAILKGPGAVTTAAPVWCPNCGSRVPEGATSCPHCGTPVDEDAPKVARVLDERLGDVRWELETADNTHSMPRIESAIPPEPDDGYHAEGSREHLPRTRVVLFSAAAAVGVVLVTVLAVTQPWNPYAYVTHALTDADTSMEGFPGLVQRLTGQDPSPEETNETGNRDVYYDQLKEAYDKLGDISSRMDANEQTLDAVLAGDESQREQGASDAQSLSLELSNLLSQVGSYDLSSSPYVGDQKNIITLGNYLRNRMDAITSGWNGNGKGSTDAWKKLFDDSYGNWEPQRAQQ